MLKSLIYFLSKAHGHLHISFDFLLEYGLKLIISSRLLGSYESFRRSYINDYKDFPATQKFLSKPEDFIQYMAIIQTAPTKEHKGILTIAYNYAIPSFLYMFDYKEIMKRYHLVLEPSTARLLMPEVLSCDRLGDTVYVEAGEPRDMKFLNRFCISLEPVPIAANWWLNTDIFNHRKQEKKQFDIIMVSTFAKLKRHHLLFDALKRLNKKDIKLNAILIGYAGCYTRDEMIAMIEKNGLSDQIIVLENISPVEIASYYRQSKVNLLLSKREGTPRTIIEGLHCGTPAMLRNGFNFGYHYPFMTEKSGAFFNDNTLDNDILALLEKVDAGLIDTVDVVSRLEINPYRAAEILRETIYPEDLTVAVEPKASGLHGMEYLNGEARSRFASEYDYLMNHLNPTLT